DVGLLHDVERPLIVTDDAAREPVQTLVVAADQHFERLYLAGQHARDDAAVVAQLGLRRRHAFLSHRCHCNTPCSRLQMLDLRNRHGYEKNAPGTGSSPSTCRSTAQCIASSARMLAAAWDNARSANNGIAPA